jgi:hypothetical protein
MAIKPTKERPPAPINADAVELVSGTLERLQKGIVVAVAIVEVYANGDVATHASTNNRYHHLLSGISRLMARMAMES